MRLSSGHTATSESAFVKDRTGENYNNLTLDVRCNVRCNVRCYKCMDQYLTVLEFHNFSSIMYIVKR